MVESRIEHWLPTIINAGLIAFFWVIVRGLYTKMDEKKKELDEKFMSENTHSLICRTNTLEMQKILTDEITKLKDEIFNKLRKIENHIIKEEKK